MCQMLAASRKAFAASRSYAKLMLCLSYETNRVAFTELSANLLNVAPPDAKHPPQQPYRKVYDEVNRQLGQSLFISARATLWTKRHVGPVQITASVSSGYASWAFEEDEEKAIEPVKLETQSKEKGKSKKKDKYKDKYAGVKPVPPSQPHSDHHAIPKHAALTGKTAAISPAHKIQQALLDANPNDLEGIKAIAEPPAGAVPLSALNHRPSVESLKQLAEKGLYVSPYLFRCRKRVPFSGIFKDLSLLISIFI